MNKPTDFNDMAVLQGNDAVKAAIDGAVVVIEETDEQVIARLASLAPLEYDRVRKNNAERLGVSYSALDRAVKQHQKANSGDINLNNELVEDCEPWHEPITPHELLSQLSSTVQRFIVCSQETADAAALWVTMTWFIDVVQVAPLAVITAPEKRCGKSQLLTLIGKLSRRPLVASNITPAALFRVIEACQPTLLIDETDAFMRENEELRGLLNAGHTRDSTYTIRLVGDTHAPKSFNVWGAKALSGIGHLADTLMDRAVTLELRRKLTGENVDKLRHAEPNLFADLSAMLARFAEDYREAVRKQRPALPESLNDRAQDNWEPLLAIANVAGNGWAERASNAAIALSGNESAVVSVGVELLADIQEIFEHKRVDRISTADLLQALCEDGEKTWATYNRGKPFTPRQLGKRLSDYGIKSKTIRLSAYDTPKGFDVKQFSDAFKRYLVTPEKMPPHQTLHPQTLTSELPENCEVTL